MLALLALLVAMSSPREPRYARLLIALLAWLVYYNLLLLARTWIGDGKLASGFGMWWVYLPMLGLAAWMIWSGQRLRAPRDARGAA